MVPPTHRSTAAWFRRIVCIAVAAVSLAGVGCGEDDAGGALPAPTSTTTVTQSKLSPGSRAAATVGQASAGRTVFETTCQVCHKIGENEVGAGPRLLGANLTEEAIKAQVRQPRDAMPPNLVSGTSLDDVTAFILQLK